ncbi:hypothetical protein PIB30_087756 [Stylosanthes scabra]|uniref:Uncharacterized protein n=1 Tax=Stylosanthes scabra TaxID=79078 RepID=A0ABU6TU84_9FABA|nr:hypothetical protein [Stylosanthes scabra]
MPNDLGWIGNERITGSERPGSTYNVPTPRIMWGLCLKWLLGRQPLTYDVGELTRPCNKRSTTLAAFWRIGAQTAPFWRLGAQQPNHAPSSSSKCQAPSQDPLFWRLGAQQHSRASQTGA